MSPPPSNDEKLEGVLVNPLEEDIEVVFDQQVNEQLKGKTLAQLKCAKASADLVSNNIGECIQEIEDKVSSSLREEKCFEEPLEQQFKRIFGFKMPSEPMTKELFQEVIIPVLKVMRENDQQFFYKHYGGVIPVEYKYKYYF